MKVKRLSEYWVGDRVLLKKSLRAGTFEGLTPSGKARIKVSGKIILSTADNLEELKEENPKKISLSAEEVTDHPTPKDFNPEIDLHIEVLDPTLVQRMPHMILSKQISACKAHIERALALRRREITIIHGKGKGQLKLEVDSLLASYDEVLYTRVIHQGGATSVGLRII